MFQGAVIKVLLNVMICVYILNSRYVRIIIICIKLCFDIAL